MTIEITDEIVVVAEEFSMSKYSSKLERDAAILQEIVDLRKENDALRNKIKDLEDNHGIYGTPDELEFS